MAVIASGSIRLNNQQGLSVGVTLENGETAVQTRFIAKDDAYGLYRVSDGVLLQGGKLMPDGRVVGVSGAMTDPDGDDNAYFAMKTTPWGVFFDLFHATHDGPGPEDIEEVDFDNMPISGWQSIIGIGAHLVPSWAPGEYMDEIHTYLNSLGDLNINSDQIGIVAIDPDTGDGKCGILLDYNRGAEIEVWGNGGSMSISKSIHPNGAADFSCHVIPSENDAYALGSTAYSKRWRRLYCVQAPDVSSDARLKKNIEDLDGSLIYRLRPRKFRMRDGDGKLRFGLIAQEVKAALDELGIEGADLYGDENPDSLSLVYEELIAPLIAAVQEQKSRIDDLESRLSALEAKIG